MGKEGLRTMGVFLRESLFMISQMVENGSLHCGLGCQQSQTRSYVTWNRDTRVDLRHIKLNS